jgi:hypothetical protein
MSGVEWDWALKKLKDGQVCFFLMMIDFNGFLDFEFEN